jgi:hypothetical protein
MCTGFELAALGLAGAGFGSSVLGQRSANKTAAAATNAQTGLSRQQFDTRNQLAKDVFAENTGLARQAFDALNALDDREFAVRTGLSKDAFNQLNDIERAQIARDAGFAENNLAELRNARQDYTSTRTGARQAYDSDIAAANTNQDRFRGRADDLNRMLLDAFSPTGQNAVYSKAVGDRLGLQGYAAGQTPSALPSARISAPLAAVFAQQSQAGKNFAADQGVRGAAIEGVSDALSAGGRRITDANLGASLLQDAATRALAPLGARLDAHSLRFNNAGDARAARVANAGADLDAGINISAQTAQGAARPVQAYSTATDDALAAFYGRGRDSVGGTASAKTAANDALLSGAAGASGAFENNMAGITDYRIRAGQNNGWTAASQFASTLAPIFAGIGQRGSVARPGATPAPNFTYGRVPGFP